MMSRAAENVPHELVLLREDQEGVTTLTAGDSVLVPAASDMQQSSVGAASTVLERHLP